MRADESGFAGACQIGVAGFDASGNDGAMSLTRSAAPH
jgi:hypothetical protein